MNKPSEDPPQTGSPIEVFLTFLKLGLTSFGGPIAHLGYFRTELVARRAWLNDQQFAQLLAICQFLPGPASSQLGFCIGLLRAGWLGAFAAFLAFTLPSALLLVIFASSLSLLTSPVGEAAIQGLKLVACAVVADAVLGMSKKLCSDIARKMIAILACAILLFVSSLLMQLLVIMVAASAGAFFLRDIPEYENAKKIQIPYGRRVGAFLLFLFAVLLLGMPLLITANMEFATVAEVFYRAGALVFGGGHVVLPLLEDSVVANGWVTSDQFLAGYGAAQAIPGPMFAFAAYLGSIISQGENTVLIAVTALIFLFLPGFLLLSGVLPFWRSVSHNPYAGRAIAGVNAAVVGVLAAALYKPIMTSGINSVTDLVIVLIAFALLVFWRVSPLIVVAWCVLASVVRLWI